MKMMVKKIYEKNNQFLKVLICIVLLGVITRNFWIQGVSLYCDTKTYEDRYAITPDSYVSTSTNTIIQYSFASKGNKITKCEIYFNKQLKEEAGTLNVLLLDSDKKIINEKSINLCDMTAEKWESIVLDVEKIHRNKIYIIQLEADDISVVDKIGIQTVWQYCNFSNTVFFLINVLLQISSFVILCWAIFKIEKLYQVFRESGAKKEGLKYAIYMSGVLILAYNPMNKIGTNITEYKRIIGAGVIAGSDVAKRINRFSVWIVLFLLSFVLFYLSINYFMTLKLGKEEQKVQKFLDKFLVIANIELILRCMNFFQNEEAENNFSYSYYTLLLIFIVSSIYILGHLGERISAENYLQLCICGYAISYAIACISKVQSKNGKLLFAVQVLYVVVALVYIIFGKLKKFYVNENTFNFITIIVCLLPLLTSAYIEMINVCNQHMIFVGHPRKYYGVLMGLICFVGAVIYFVYVKCFWKIKDYKKISYLMLVAGVSALSVQIPLQGVYNADVFETANSSVLISDFLNFGTIPLVEHYGGHMMTDVWEGILYAYLNDDFIGAIFSPYAVYIKIPLAIFLYLLFAYIWEPDMALIITLFLPVYSGWNYFGLGMLICIAMLVYLKKNTYFRAFLIWITIVWCVIYRLDLGVAFGIASIVTLVIYTLYTHSRKMGEQLLISFCVMCAGGVATWFLLCINKSIDPVKRLLEFLNISLSNLNWAYEGLGDMSLMAYSWCYIFIPFIMIVILFYCVTSKKFKNNVINEKWMILVFLGVSYFANFSRGLVRHSLVENDMTVVMWTAYVFIAMFMGVYKEGGKKFIVVYSVFILCNSLLMSDSAISSTTISDVAVEKMDNYTKTWSTSSDADELSIEIGEIDDADIIDMNSVYRTDSGNILTVWEALKYKNKRVNRVVWAEEISEKTKMYEKVIDLLLDDNETFIDFMNRSFMYSALNRKNPVYVSQSPMQLSGEYTQERFIEEIEKADAPIVLMPTTHSRGSVILDEISNVYRNYKVAEYIYICIIYHCANLGIMQYGVSWSTITKCSRKSLKIQKLK